MKSVTLSLCFYLHNQLTPKKEMLCSKAINQREKEDDKLSQWTVYVQTIESISIQSQSCDYVCNIRR